MTRILVAAGVVWLGVSSLGWAQTRQFSNPTLENLRQKYSAQAQARSGSFGGSAWNRGSRRDFGHDHGHYHPGHHHHGYGYRSFGLFLNVGPYGYPPYYYDSLYDPYYGYPYGVYYDSYSNNAQYYLPPTYLPGELLYGPQAMYRFLGLHRQGQAAVAAAAAADREPPRVEAGRFEVRKSNAEAVARASRFLEFGDNLFAEQEFHSALQRYKSAAEAAPDLSEAYFRQGHALVATKRYDLAVKAFKVAIALATDIDRGEFRMDELYGDGKALAKSLHLEDLARAGLDRPRDADVMLLIGLFLYYDGQADRAERFLRQAMDLDPTLTGSVSRYLDDVPAAAGAVRT